MPAFASARTPVVALPLIMALHQRVGVPMIEVAFSSVAGLRGSMLAARHAQTPVVIRLPAGACGSSPDAAARLAAAVVGIADDVGVVFPIALVVDIGDDQPLSVPGQVERAIAAGASAVAIAVSSRAMHQVIAATATESMPYEFFGSDDDVMAWLSAADAGLTPIAVRGHDPDEALFASSQSIITSVAQRSARCRMVVPPEATELQSYHTFIRIARQLGVDGFANAIGDVVEQVSG